jgi:hypothetical protein
MQLLFSSTLSLDIIAMAASIGLVVWSFQIKNGNMLAMVGGTLLFIFSVLSMSATGYFGSHLIMAGGNPLEHKMMQREEMKLPQ